MALRPVVWAGAALLLASLLVAPPAQAGRARVRSAAFNQVTQSTGTLPIVLAASDASTLAAAVAQANSIGCGVHIDVSGTITANIVLEPRCPNPDQLGIRLRGPATLYGGVQVQCMGANCAWASLERLTVVAQDDAFDATGDARMAVIASDATVDGQYSNVLTSHQSSWLLAIGCSGRSISNLPAPPLAFIQNSRAIVVGSGEFRTGTASYDAALNLGGSDPGSQAVAALLGHTLRCIGINQHAVDLEPGFGGSVSLLWAGSNPNCPMDLALGYGERASVTSYGIGSVVPLPFTIPAWVMGAATGEVELSF